MWAIIWTMGNIHFVYLTWSIRAKHIVVDCGHLSAIFPFNISYCQHFTMFCGSARGLIKMKNKKTLHSQSSYGLENDQISTCIICSPIHILCITISISIIILSISIFTFVEQKSLSTFYDVPSKRHLKMKNDISIAIIILSVHLHIWPKGGKTNICLLVILTSRPRPHKHTTFIIQ